MASLRGSVDAYRLVHVRVRRARGRASNFACINCGWPAHDWSLLPHNQCLGTLAVVRVIEAHNPTGEARWFSNDIGDYVPRCRLDHCRADRAERESFVAQWERVLDEHRVYGADEW